MRFFGPTRQMIFPMDAYIWKEQGTKEEMISRDLRDKSRPISRCLDIIRAECRVSHEFHEGGVCGREKFRSSECHLIDSTCPPSSLDRPVAVAATAAASSHPIMSGVRTVGSWFGSRKVFQIEDALRRTPRALPFQVWRGNRRFGMTRFRSNGRAASSIPVEATA